MLIGARGRPLVVALRRGTVLPGVAAPALRSAHRHQGRLRILVPVIVVAIGAIACTRHALERRDVLAVDVHPYRLSRRLIAHRRARRDRIRRLEAPHDFFPDTVGCRRRPGSRSSCSSSVHSACRSTSRSCTWWLTLVAAACAVLLVAVLPGTRSSGARRWHSGRSARSVWFPTGCISGTSSCSTRSPTTASRSRRYVVGRAHDHRRMHVLSWFYVEQPFLRWKDRLESVVPRSIAANSNRCRTLARGRVRTSNFSRAPRRPRTRRGS